jgi:hypothetical protein
MTGSATEKEKVSALVGDAQASLADLLQFDELHGDRWYMRLSADGKVYPWEALTTDSTENDETIKGKIARSERPVTDLVLAFVGSWIGKASSRGWRICNISEPAMPPAWFLAAISSDPSCAGECAPMANS